MKSAYLLSLTLVTVVFLGFLVPQAHADDANGISIQNISVQPYAVKVGDTFTVTATLVNNSTFPIFVSDMPSKDCQGPFFTVSFDDNAKVTVTTKDGMTCSYVGHQERLDPGKKYTGTSPGLSFTYTATQSGIANVTVTFPHEIKNQTDSNQSNIDQAISKSFLFTIYDNNTNISIPHHGVPAVKSLLTPLKQLKSGVAIKDITCKASLQLIIKTEDNSPACVTPETAQKLVGQGWAQQTIALDYTNLTHVDLVSIQSVPPVNPGGPNIQLTLKNPGTIQITSLRATLELNNEYNFDFKDITLSKPLESGQSVSDTEILIGAGFRTEMSYPLTISGIANHMPFRHTENVYIRQ